MSWKLDTSSMLRRAYSVSESVDPLLESINRHLQFKVSRKDPVFQQIWESWYGHSDSAVRLVKGLSIRELMSDIFYIRARGEDLSRGLRVIHFIQMQKDWPIVVVERFISKVQRFRRGYSDADLRAWNTWWVENTVKSLKAYREVLRARPEDPFWLPPGKSVKMWDIEVSSLIEGLEHFSTDPKQRQDATMDLLVHMWPDLSGWHI